jgi:hypothetical protein
MTQAVPLFLLFGLFGVPTLACTALAWWRLRYLTVRDRAAADAVTTARIGIGINVVGIAIPFAVIAHFIFWPNTLLFPMGHGWGILLVGLGVSGMSVVCGANSPHEVRVALIAAGIVIGALWLLALA